MVRTHHPQLAEPAVGVRVERRRTEVADPRVEVGPAGEPRGQAPVADQLRRVDGHREPDLGGGTRADRGDPAGDLVPQHQRVLQHCGPRGRVAPVREVRPADPAPLHRDEHLTGARYGVGPLVDAQVVGAVDMRSGFTSRPCTPDTARAHRAPCARARYGVHQLAVRTPGRPCTPRIRRAHLKSPCTANATRAHRAPCARSGGGVHQPAVHTPAPAGTSTSTPPLAGCAVRRAVC